MPLYQILIIETVVVFILVLIMRKVIAGIRRKAQKNTTCKLRATVL